MCVHANFTVSLVAEKQKTFFFHFPNIKGFHNNACSLKLLFETPQGRACWQSQDWAGLVTGRVLKVRVQRC